MNKVIRALAAAGAIAVVPLGLASPAHASTQDHNSGYGWVTVCQKVYDYQHGNDYEGTYSIEDYHHNTWDFYLDGGYDCYTQKVHSGWVNVDVNDYPHDADLADYQHDSYHFKLHSGEYRKITFKYYDSGYNTAHAPAA